MSAGLRGFEGQIALDVRGDGEGDCVDIGQQVPVAVIRPRGQCFGQPCGLWRSPTPDSDQLDARRPDKPGAVSQPCPGPGSDQTTLLRAT